MTQAKPAQRRKFLRQAATGVAATGALAAPMISKAQVQAVTGK